MKFYIAATSDQRVEARKVMDFVEAHEQTVFLDWTKDSLLEKPYTKKKKEAQYRSERDIKAIMESDIFILLSSNESAHKGAHVELGVAIASNILNGKPQIFIIGEYNTHNLFNFYSEIQRVESIDDVFKILNK